MMDFQDMADALRTALNERNDAHMTLRAIMSVIRDLRTPDCETCALREAMIMRLLRTVEIDYHEPRRHK